MKRKPDELSDEELMALYQQGDEWAFNQLFARYSNRVYGYLRKRIHNPQAANDIFQASFLKLHRSREQFNSSFLFVPWLFAVVRTVLLDWQKDSRNKVSHAELTDEMAGPLAEAPPLARIDIASLPEPQRSAVTMRYFDDLSFEEIAGRLNTTSVNARQLVSRGIKSLRSFFAKGGLK